MLRTVESVGCPGDCAEVGKACWCFEYCALEWLVPLVVLAADDVDVAWCCCGECAEAMLYAG